MTVPKMPPADDVIDYRVGAGPESMFDADSMRRYGEACYLAGMEASAQEIDMLARQAWANGAARECAALEGIAVALRGRITIPS